MSNFKKIIFSNKEFNILQKQFAQECKEYLVHEKIKGEEIEFVSKFIQEEINKILPNINKNNNITYRELIKINNCGFIESGEITFRHVYFNNEEEYKDISNHLSHNRTGIQSNNRNLNISKNNKLNEVNIEIVFPLIDGKIMSDILYIFIFHEIENLYNLYQKKSKYNTEIKEKYLFSDKKLMNILTNKANPYRSQIEKLIFLSNLIEQDSIKKHLYGFFNKYHNEKDEYETLWNNKATCWIYNTLLNLQKEVPLWEKNNFTMNAKRKTYKNKLDFDLFKKNLSEFINRTIVRYCGKVGEIYSNVWNSSECLCGCLIYMNDHHICLFNSFVRNIRFNKPFTI
jgi:hypothetical protein